MSQGIYERTKKHREEFKERMHAPEIIKKREKTKRKNREEVEKVEVEEDNKSNTNACQINNLDREELNDKLEELKHRILKKVKELAGNLTSLKNLQDERDRIEVRLEELGMKF